MGKIEFAGRLKPIIHLDGVSYQCNDVNFDKDFLITLSKYFIKIVNNSDIETQLKYSRFFEEERICIVEFELNFDTKKYKVVFTRDTQFDKIIIGCEVKAVEAETELFGTAYQLKLQVISLFNRICDNSSIYLLEDFNNELICQNAYLQIHKVENRFRNLLTKYLIRKYGKLVLSKPLKKDVDDYSKWFKESKNKYKTFKKINTDYANLDFSKLAKILDLYDAKCIDETGTSIFSNLESIVNDLDDDIDYTVLNSNIAKLKDKVAKRIKIFDDIKTIDDEADTLFGFSFKKSEDIITILDSDFRKLWESELSKMRNMVAHNKPICKELYNEIIENCRIVNEKFDKCFDYIDSYFYPDEEGVYSALEDMAYEEEERNRFDIDEARESVGIQFSLDEDCVEEQILEADRISRFITIISVLEDISSYVEVIKGINDELRFLDDEEISVELKEKIFNHIKGTLSLECEFKDYQSYEIIDILYELVYKDIDIDKAIEFYSYDNYYRSLNDNFEVFSLDYQMKWLTLDNQEYEIVFYGVLEPENGGIDYLEFDLYIGNKKIKNYTIEVDYGDYRTPSDGDIRDSRVDELVDDIKDSISETIDKYKLLYDLSEKIMGEL